MATFNKILFKKHVNVEAKNKLFKLLDECDVLENASDSYREKVSETLKYWSGIIAPIFLAYATNDIDADVIETIIKKEKISAGEARQKILTQLEVIEGVELGTISPVLHDILLNIKKIAKQGETIIKYNTIVEKNLLDLIDATMSNLLAKQGEKIREKLKNNIQLGESVLNIYADCVSIIKTAEHNAKMREKKIVLEKQSFQENEKLIERQIEKNNYQSELDRLRKEERELDIKEKEVENEERRADLETRRAKVREKMQQLQIFLEDEETGTKTEKENEISKKKIGS